MPFKSVGDEMRRFYEGDLHSGGSGKVVQSRAQAIAIALSEKRAKEGKRKKGKSLMEMANAH